VSEGGGGEDNKRPEIEAVKDRDKRKKRVAAQKKAGGIQLTERKGGEDTGRTYKKQGRGQRVGVGLKRGEDGDVLRQTGS